MRNIEPARPALTRRGLLTQLAAFTLAMAGGVAARGEQTRTTTKAQWDPAMELAVDLEIRQPDDFRYRRPYVAVWLEDASGKEVRTLSLWVENSRRGFRWISELRRWYRDARDLWVGGGPDLIATVSSATRMPGKYSLTWDGKDDRGKLVAPGKYVLNLESAREHGPYGLVQKEITIASKPFRIEVDGTGDIQGATIEYRKRKAT